MKQSKHGEVFVGEDKKEPTPKVRGGKHFLFVRDKDGDLNTFIEIASYTNLKLFKEGVKEKAKALAGQPTPKWVHFTGKFKDVGIEQISDVKVKL
jgi:hypothetical protein